MVSLTFLCAVAGLLFVMAYATHRRFGTLGLALAAGSLLSTNWASTVTPFIEQQGIQLVSPPLEVVVKSLLIILPPALLLLSGPSYQGTWQRLGGAAAFAVLGVAFLIEPLISALQLDEPGAGIITFISKYSGIIIVTGIIGAVADMLFTGRHKGKKREH